MLRSVIKLCAALAIALAGTTVIAQEYPARPVKLLVPFAAGGPADVYARFLAQRLQESMGQPFVVEDRPGGGAVLGTEIVAKSAPDGYTLLVMSNTHTVNESLLPNPPTIAEAGVPGYEATIWLGVMAPKGTPPAIVNRLNAEITKIVSRPEVKADWEKQGAVAMMTTPAEFGKYLGDDIVKWER